MSLMTKIKAPCCDNNRYLSQMVGGTKDAELCIYCEKALKEAEKRAADKGADTIAEEIAQEKKLLAAKEYASKEEARRRVEEVAKKKAEEIVFNKEKEAQREVARRMLAKKHLLPFVMRFNKKYEPGWVHKDICRRLERFAEQVKNKESPRLMLFMPPRHGKSEIASRSFPAWYLGHNPDHEIIACSYSSSLAQKFGKKAREILRESTFRNVFPKCVINEKNAGVENWTTTEGGGYMPAGVGGPITGNGAHVLIIDDPVKNREDAESETMRQTNKDWYSSTALTRLAPGGGVLVILTRWHEDDLAGWLLDEQNQGADEWDVIRYPAIAEQDEPYRKKGDPLHAERYDLKALERFKRALIPRDWQALYQQRPVADDGDYFQRDMFKWFEDFEQLKKEKGLRVNYYSTWDLAIGQNQGNDYTVGVTAAVDQYDNIYVIDVQRGHWDGLEIVDRVLDAHLAYNTKLTGIEKGHIEMALGPLLDKRIQERRMYSFHYEGLRCGRQDKMARARTIQGRLRQGKVFLPKNASFTSTLVDEMLKFPVGKHDDQVDAMAWLGLIIQEFYAPAAVKPPKEKSWRDKLPGMMKSQSSSSYMSA